MLKVGFGELTDYQSGLAQLNAGIKSTGGAANVTAPFLETLATKIQGYSGQTDDSIVASEKLLLTFTKIRNSTGKNNDIFTQATKITADMAAKFGGDASASAIQLGKALNDPTTGMTALQRIGISFTDTQKKSIKSFQAHGDIVSAQKIILAELTTEVGGSAKAFGDSLPGKLARSKRAFEDVSQNLVQALLPIITKVADIISTKVIPAFSGLVDFLSRNSAVIGPLAAVIGTLAAVVITITKVSKAWAEVQTALNIVLTANPIGLIIVGVALLVAGIVIAYKNSETFRNIVNAVFRSVADVVLGSINSILGVLESMFRALGHIPGVGGAFRAVANEIHGARSAVQGLKNSIDGLPTSKSIRIGVETVYTSVGAQGATSGVGPIKMRAGGGSINAGELYRVGENEPEWFVSDKAGQIMNQRQARNAGLTGSPSRRSGGDTHNWHLTTTADPVAIAHEQSWLMKVGAL